MAIGNEEYPGPIHGAATRRSNYRYFFHPKHHRNVPSSDAQWLLEPELTLAQEFNVFDLADLHILADQHGNLYGTRPKNGDGALPTLGNRGEQVAIFPMTRPPRAWHGYPIWPIEVVRDSNRRRPVPGEVLNRMLELELITANERSRLKAGKHI